METQNALVIGIGYVGIRLVEKFNSLGIKVFGLSRNEKSLEKLERYDAQKNYWDENLVSLKSLNSINSIPVTLIFNDQNQIIQRFDGELDQESYFKILEIVKK